MRTLAVVNQKGGCGKTTSAINLSGVFASRGYRTLLVDMDPQGHCAAGLAIPEQRIDLQIGDAMLADANEPIDPKRLLWRVMRNLDLAPATLRLAALEASRGELANLPDAEHRLKNVLNRFDSQYDICLIDCSPAVGMLAFNAMVAASEVIIPVETGFFSLQGATKQINAIKSLGKRLGVAPVHRLLATMHDPTSALSQDLLDELRRRFGARVLPTVIRYDHALREAASFGQPVIEYAPDSVGASDYSALADYLIEDAKASGGERATGIPPATTDELRITMIPATSHGPAGEYAAAANPATGPSVGVPNESQVSAGPAPISRQMDMVMRTRKMQGQSEARASENGVAIAEMKPIADLFGLAPGPVATQGTAPAAREVEVPPLRAAPAGFGVSATEDGLAFSQPAGLGSSLAVAGDFNAWNPQRGQLHLNAATGAFELRLVCPPGTYQYRLVVDGQWMPDPYNPVVSSNPFGGSNSVAIVPARGRAASIGGSLR